MERKSKYAARTKRKIVGRKLNDDQLVTISTNGGVYFS